MGEDVLVFFPSEIGCHSIRSACAMTLYLAGFGVATIMLIGQWRSYSFLLQTLGNKFNNFLLVFLLGWSRVNISLQFLDFNPFYHFWPMISFDFPFPVFINFHSFIQSHLEIFIALSSWAIGIIRLMRFVDFSLFPNLVTYQSHGTGLPSNLSYTYTIIDCCWRSPLFLMKDQIQTRRPRRILCFAIIYLATAYQYTATSRFESCES